MSDYEETVLVYWKEHREQLRQSETQRSTLTNILLIVTAGVSALVVQQRFSASVIPLTIFITAIGGYGALTVSKYHERARYHLTQARALTAMLVASGVLGSKETLNNMREEHYKEFPTLRRIRLHILWTSLHVGIVAYGLTLFAICMVHAK